MKNHLKKILSLCALAVLLLPLAITFGQGANTLSWDYGISPSTDVLCSATVTQDCIQSFALAYESSPGTFTQAATVSASICVARTGTGGGWTCTAPIPTVPGRKYKPNVWAAWAISADAVTSANSNTAATQVKPNPPAGLKTP